MKKDESLNDIDYLKNIIDRTKINLSALTNLFLFSGCTLLILRLAYYICFYSSLYFGKALYLTELIFLFLNMMFIPIVLLLFGKASKTPEILSNYFSKQLFNLWIFNLAFLGLIMYLFRIFLYRILDYLFIISAYVPLLEWLDFVSHIETLIIIASIFMTAVIIRNSLLKIISICILLLYIVTFLLPDITTNLVLFQQESTLPVAHLYSNIIFPVSCIFMGVYFKKTTSISGTQKEGFINGA